MLVFKSKPKSVNQQEIFHHDSPLLMGFIILGILCQFWSGFSEFIGLNDYLIKLSAIYTNKGMAKWIGNGLAFGIALTIEVTTFALITFIVNSFYNGYLKLSKSDELTNIVKISNWIKFGVAVGVLFFIVWLSATVSKKNVEHSTKANPPKAILEDTEKFDLQQKEAISIIEKRYDTDKKEAYQGYQEDRRLTQTRYDAVQNDLKEKVKHYQRREISSGKKYATKISQLKGSLRASDIEQADSLKALKDRHALYLLGLRKSRDESIQNIKGQLNKDKSIVQNRNMQVEQATAERNSWLSAFLKRYAQYAVFGFLFARIWVCISYNTCGIQPKVFVRPEFFESSLLKDLSLLVYTYPTRTLHNCIRKYLAKIPALVPIESKGAVVSLSTSVNLDHANQSVYVHPETSNLNTSVYDELLQKELNVNLNNGTPLTNGTSVNRRPIGFKVADKRQDDTTYENRIYETTIQKEVLVQKAYTRQCLHCSGDFTPNHNKQKYCETKCRKRAWEERTGRKLKLKPKKKA